jgi:hypothetical protein
VYESRPCNVIINLGIQLYRTLEVATPTGISLIFAKKCNKVISHTGKFIFFVICAHINHKVFATSMASTQSFSLKKEKVHILLTHWGTDALPSQTSN